jgi:hypothetical protein
MDLLFISGPGRSGTTLMKDLLDGHPEIAMWPNEWQYLSIYKKYIGKELSKELDYKQAIESLLQDTSKFQPVVMDIATDNRLGTEIKISDINPGFRKRLLNKEVNKEVGAETLYKIIGEQYLWRSEQHIFANKCNDPNNILDYYFLFMKARFLFIIRDPIECYLSKIRHRARGIGFLRSHLGGCIFTESFNEIRNFYKSLELLDIAIEKLRYLIIKIEDLVKDEDRVLARLCDFCNIETGKSLHQLTYLESPINGYFVDQREHSQFIVKNTNEYFKLGLTEREKEWFSYNRGLFESYYPYLLDKIEETPTVSLKERSAMFFQKYRKEQALSVFENDFHNYIDYHN